MGRLGSQIAESYHLGAPVWVLWLFARAGAGWRLRAAARRPPSVRTSQHIFIQGVRAAWAEEQRQERRRES
jgi:hypothetical protein